MAKSTAKKPAAPKVTKTQLRDWSSRLVAIHTHLDQVSPGTDVQLAQTKRSLAAQLESVQQEIDAVIEPAK